MGLYVEIMALSSEHIKHVVSESVRHKAEIVAQDEKEAGIRNILNFGHTVGHGIEACVMDHMLHGEYISLQASICQH